MKNAAIVIFLLLGPVGFSSFQSSYSQPEYAEYEIKWLTWENALEKYKKQKRKIFIYVYTDWCGWCKRMDKSTFKNPQIAEYVNDNYYSIKFNAESKEDIVFKGKTYRFAKNGMRGYHELAAEITRGRLSYPTAVFLDEDLGVIQPVPGFKNVTEFEQIITYFGCNEHKKTPWEVYKQNYKPMNGN
jgi:thioredoxin-related protein